MRGKPAVLIYKTLMQLNEVVPWGRTFAEYKLMFDLSEIDLKARILGCGDGPASFNAEMTELGHSVISVDPLYQFSAAQIKQQVQATYGLVISQIKQNADRYVWQTFPDADALGQARLSTMERFLQDYEAGRAEGRYQFQALPNLEKIEGQFDLCVCSHLLFLYSKQLSLDFHLASIRELLRVAPDVRIFPLIQLDGTPSAYLDQVIEEFIGKGFHVQIQTVDYEFQKGGNQMLKIAPM
ncbi:MAG TPA: SAM-dependent methyltransferase [Coleofasciculaceae cyanobacterium]|jgi:SAM-dependent methyltransferase